MLLFSPILAAAIFILFLFGYLSLGAALLLLIPSLLILAASIILILLLRRENSGTRQKAEIQRLDELHSLYNSLHGLRHDLKNHLQVASALIRQGQAQQGSAYLDTIEQDIFSLFSTGCLPLDSALTLKELDMRQHHIRFEHQLCQLSSLPVSDYEFCSIVGNLLDNAIEAHERYTGSDEYIIGLNIRRVRDMLYIECVNPADARLMQTSSGKLISSKSGQGHGLGIANIESIVSRAQGHCSFKCIDGKFTAILALPCND